MSRLARRNESLFLNPVVLCEFAWVLRSRYGSRKPEIIKAIEDLLGLDLFVLEHAEAFQKAVVRYREGPAGFADYLIGAINSQAGCDDTVTFDRRLGTAEGFTRIG